jgi:hypothetical protein
MLRELAYVFIIMAFDKLNARAEDLIVTAQCEATVSKFEGAISTLHHLKEDLSSTLLNQFHRHQFPSQFHDYVNGMRERTPGFLGAVAEAASYEVCALQSSAMQELILWSLAFEYC